jgi:hypothetical protein
LGQNALLDAYQIAFDLSEAATQSFVEGVRKKLAEAGLAPQGGAVSDSSYLTIGVLIGAGEGRTEEAVRRYSARREKRGAIPELPEQER